MKNNILFTAVFTLMLVFVSCEEETWLQPDIKLVPIYSLTEIEGGTPFSMEVYREQPLLIENSTTAELPKLTNYETNLYSDTTNQQSYGINFSVDIENVYTETDILTDSVKHEDVTVVEIHKDYTILGDVETSVGTLKIESTEVSTLTTIVYQLQANGDWVFTENPPVVEESSSVFEGSAVITAEERYN
ncbi:hypothetical protein [Saccharicrinis aurantiacus]|uniref:hypothetical protein n=1 Tax=Saccharicrinis aurantiacus TaxID=1849719 RepID=UPI00094FF31A|nr:hypothetical protein [Saccharicrinis aurantiacus]